MTYDPEAAVSEYEAMFLPEGIKADNPREQEMADIVLAAHRNAHTKWLRAALDAAYRAGKREAWGKAHEIVTKFELEGVVLPTNERRRVHTNSVRIDVEDAARADGVEL